MIGNTIKNASNNNDINSNRVRKPSNTQTESKSDNTQTESEPGTHH